jgi:starch synthase (maltosyl-transferring)
VAKTAAKTATRTGTKPRAARPSASEVGYDRPLRVVIERVAPEIDGGRFPIKRTPGEEVVVTADIFTDGHDKVAAVLRYRPVEPGREHDWREAPMEELGNDRWIGRFVVERQQPYEYTLAGWVDGFESWRHELRKKVDAGQNVSSELVEGSLLVRSVAEHLRATLEARARGAADRQSAGRPGTDTEAGTRDWLLSNVAFIGGEADPADRVRAALDPALAAAMRRHADRHLEVQYVPALRIDVDRERARYGSWYEMFPRSGGPDPGRSATFDEAARRLPDIAALGFDVLYLPPIHPIGHSFRKGRNNTLVAAPGDPGSPWAIGSEAGGHKSVEPGLGTIEDFDRFVATAQHLGLEIALDIAYQCSPDHPYVREHPEWFRHRPDGTIKYAENPPKKYQDIYPLNFESEHWRELWLELKDVVLFWISHGVKIFRVDNPHTKPFRFWEWMIREVRRDHPEAIFLSEAFTRPKVMRYLAKSGFNQSYTYFTWRNTKAEIIEYFTELTQTEVREYMRPNLFANTPDILHAYLQQGGRPAFQVRLILAATLGAAYGIYSGFELCENRAVPGTEEYLDSEKYQIRHWDWDRPGSITELVARVNRIRREHRALQFDWGLQFHPTDNDQVICYSKLSPEADDLVLVVVNLDPFHMQHGWVQLPAGRAGHPPGVTYEVRDLLSDERYFWRGEWNYVRLDPEIRPAHILRVQR